MRGQYRISRGKQLPKLGISKWSLPNRIEQFTGMSQKVVKIAMAQMGIEVNPAVGNHPLFSRKSSQKWPPT